FAERQFSPPFSPSTYAQYVAECCLHRRIDCVASVQKLITDMEVGRQPDQWDILLPAVYMEEPFDPQHQSEAVRQKRATHEAHPNGSMRPRRLAWVAGMAIISMLGVGVVLQSSLASRKLRESTTRSVSSPAVVLPPRSVWREQPILPHRPV